MSDRNHPLSEDRRLAVSRSIMMSKQRQTVDTNRTTKSTLLQGRSNRSTIELVVSRPREGGSPGSRCPRAPVEAQHHHPKSDSGSIVNAGR
jgi:hypothetical protein